MKQETQKLLSLGLELPPVERASLARELLRSAGAENPILAGEVAEKAAAYGDYAPSTSPAFLGTYPSRSLWDGTRVLRETTDLDPVELEEVYEEVRNRSRERGVALAIAQAEAALATLKGSPRVVRLEVELGQDPFGNARADIEVILADHPRSGLYTWSQLEPISDLIWQAFNEKAEDGPWPFINFHQESETDVVDEDEALAV